MRKSIFFIIIAAIIAAVLFDATVYASCSGRLTAPLAYPITPVKFEEVKSATVARFALPSTVNFQLYDYDIEIVAGGGECLPVEIIDYIAAMTTNRAYLPMIAKPLPQPTPTPAPTLPALITADVVAIRPGESPIPSGWEILADEWHVPADNTNVATAYRTYFAKKHSSGTGYTKGIETVAVVHNYDAAAASADMQAWKNRLDAIDGCSLITTGKFGDESYAVACYWRSNDWDWVKYFAFYRKGHVRVMASYWGSADRSGISDASLPAIMMLSDNGMRSMPVESSDEGIPAVQP